MTANGNGGLRERFGRPLRLGVIGGGPESFIGRMHRGAAEMDGWFRVVAGVLSSDAVARARQRGRHRARPGALLRQRRRDARRRARAFGRHRRGGDHDAERHPLSVCGGSARRGARRRLRQAGHARLCPGLRPRAAHARGGRLFAIVHGYSAYPMIRYARQLVRDGTLGRVRLVQIEYLQNGLATMIEDGPLTAKQRWLLDPARSGQALVMSAIGCHAQHLASFVAGIPAVRVAADVGTLRPGRKVVDHVSALVEYEGGARGTFTATQASAGAENDIRLKVHGERGQSSGRTGRSPISPSRCRGSPSRRSAGGTSTCRRRSSPRGARRAGTRRACARRSPTSTRSSPRSASRATSARRIGPFPYPRIEDGAHTMAFIEACVASQAKGGWAEVAKVPGADRRGARAP